MRPRMGIFTAGITVALTVALMLSCHMPGAGDAAGGVRESDTAAGYSNGGAQSSPCAADIDGDGKEEILCGDVNFLCCLNCDGTQRWAVDTGDWVGSSPAAKEWYFAEGTTREGFDEWLCIQNPNTEPMTVNALFTVGEGQGDSVARSFSIPDLRRHTVSVNDVVGPEKDVSVKLTSDYAFIAERPMYFNYQDKWPGGHDVVGF